MKGPISIILVVLLMLNVMGYYGLFMGLKYKHTVHVRERIDAQEYKESETITIKVALAVPYFGNTEFERVDGEIEHEGQFYRLVKQKLEKDTLHIVCIRDPRAERIHEALSDYVRTFADQSADQSGSRTIQSLIKDYFPSSFNLYAASVGWSSGLSFKTPDVALTEHFLSNPSPPPKV